MKGKGSRRSAIWRVAEMNAKEQKTGKFAKKEIEIPSLFDKRQIGQLADYLTGKRSTPLDTIQKTTKEEENTDTHK